MIHKDGKSWFVECDGCADTEELEAETFDEAVVEIKADNWEVAKISGEWNHICPDCKASI